MKNVTLQRFGIATCGLSLGLFGCPQPGAVVDDGADSGLPVAGNTGGGGTNNSSGGSGNAGGGVGVLDRSVIVTPNSPTLFVADVDNGAASFANAHVTDGDVDPTTFFDTFERLRVTINQGRGEQMNAFGVCVDRTGTLIILCRVEGDLFLRFYDDAATVTGIPDADRAIRIGEFGDTSGGLAYDRENDRLFVVVNDSVVIFDGAALSQNGNVPPTRSFSHPDIPDASIALGPNGDLYVTGGFQTVLVFANAGLRSGAATPDRTIFLSFFSRQTVFVDSLDRLYVSDSSEIAVLEKASTLDGTIDNFPIIELERLNAPGFGILNNISGLVVDSRGAGYVAVADDGDIHVVDNIGTRSGLIRADRVIVYDASIDAGNPDQIFLWE